MISKLKATSCRHHQMVRLAPSGSTLAFSALQQRIQDGAQLIVREARRRCSLPLAGSRLHSGPATRADHENLPILLGEFQGTATFRRARSGPRVCPHQPGRDRGYS